MAIAGCGRQSVLRERASDSAILPLRFGRHEFAGRVGDISVMFPLAVGASVVAHVSLVSVFLCMAAS